MPVLPRWRRGAFGDPRRHPSQRPHPGPGRQAATSLGLVGRGDGRAYDALVAGLDMDPDPRLRNLNRPARVPGNDRVMLRRERERGEGGGGGADGRARAGGGHGRRRGRRPGQRLG